MNEWVTELRAAYAEARKNGTEKGFAFARPDPGAAYSPRFLALAERAPEGPDAVLALNLAIKTSGSSETRARAIKIIRDYYVARPQIKGLLRFVKWDDKESQDLRNEVLARNPDRKIQAMVYKGRIAGCKDRGVQRAGHRSQAASRPGGVLGQGTVRGATRQGGEGESRAGSAQKDPECKYSEFAHELLIGEPAPEIVTHDVTGMEARLSALKGKVVVLDFWATWCGGCIAMIPHERTLVEQLKGQAVRAGQHQRRRHEGKADRLPGQGKDALDALVERQRGGILEDWNIHGTRRSSSWMPMA